MEAGRLDRRIVLQTPATTQNAIGEMVPTWSAVATTWAAIEDLTGREYQAAQAVQNGTETRIRIRWRAGVVPAMRVVAGDVIYDIQAVLDRDGSKTELQLMCRRGVSNG